MEALKQNKMSVFNVKTAKKIMIFLVICIVFDYFLFPFPALAADDGILDGELILDEKQKIYTDEEQFNLNRLPETQEWQVSWTSYYTLSAYNSEEAQCDSTPCITANGFNVCEHGEEDTIAANFLRFGTKVRIPELFGDRIFVVRDRMNARYTDRIDIWMKSKADAKKFGIKISKIEVLE